ncbi:MAG: carboxypeptidase-like regulatory domain-containing protein [Pyrinomonadaceae bacterium]
MRKQVLIGLITMVLLTLIGAGSFYPVKSDQDKSQQNNTTQGGVIMGSVINAEGRPVAHANVRAKSFRGSRGRQPETRTDQQGKFTLTNLSPDTYLVVVRKDEDGYLRTDSTFHADGVTTPPQITVGDNQTIQDVILHIGQKGGKLTGQVIDAVTSEPIRNADISFRRTDNPKAFYSTGVDFLEGKGRFKIIVPTEPFTMEVSAPGYEDWTYSSDGSGKHKDPLKLAKEETRNLKIALRPVK